MDGTITQRALLMDLFTIVAFLACYTVSSSSVLHRLYFFTQTFFYQLRGVGVQQRYTASQTSSPERYSLRPLPTPLIVTPPHPTTPLQTLNGYISAYPTHTRQHVKAYYSHRRMLCKKYAQLNALIPQKNNNV